MTVTEIRNKDGKVVVKVRVVEGKSGSGVRIIQLVEMAPEGLEVLKYSKPFVRL